MNLMSRHRVEKVMAQFEQGEISRGQAVQLMLDIPENPDFKGIWEMLILHVMLIEVSKNLPDTSQLVRHWQTEINAWQKRIVRFTMKPKASHRNAVKKHFYQASDHLFKDDYANLLFSLEGHLEEIIGADLSFVADKLAELSPDSKEMEWFLSYSHTSD